MALITAIFFPFFSGVPFLRRLQKFLRPLFLICLLQLQVIQVLSRRFQSQFLGQNEISRISVVHIDNFSLFSKGLHIFQ